MHAQFRKTATELQLANAALTSKQRAHEILTYASLKGAVHSQREENRGLPYGGGPVPIQVPFRQHAQEALGL
jgi:hypothetical protein